MCTYKNESPSPLLCIDIYCSIWDLTPIFMKHFNSYLLCCIDPLKCVHLIPISLRPEVTPLSDESSENQITLCYRFQLLAFDIRTLGYAALFHTIWYFLVLSVSALSVKKPIDFTELPVKYKTFSYDWCRKKNRTRN